MPADHLNRAVDMQLRTNDSVLNHYRAMLSYRKKHRALMKGAIALTDAPEGVLAFIREDGGERLFCAFNMTSAAIVYPLPADIAPAPSDAPGSVAEPVGNALSLPPFGGYIGVLG